MSPVAGNMDKQINQVFSNLKAIAHAAGGDLSMIVKLTIFLTNLDDFEAVNKAMSVFLSRLSQPEQLWVWLHYPKTSVLKLMLF